MVSLQVSILHLRLTLGVLLLDKLTIYAQQFLSPDNDVDKFGFLSGSVDFVWTYTTTDISRTSINCELNRKNIVFRKADAGATAVIQREFLTKADAIDDTASSPRRFGFKLKNLAFLDAGLYGCSIRYDGGAPVSSKVYNFKIYERPVFVNCLTDGLFVESTGIRYFNLREGDTLNSTCYVYGSPVPTLDCRTYGNAKNQQAALTKVTRNYTSLPLTNRMLFDNVKRGVAKVECVADGGLAGKRTIMQDVRVDHLPSVPRSIMLMESTPASIKIRWEAPLQPGVSRITNYYMELQHPNGSTTMTNYTVSTWVLEYTFSNLFANVKYGIRISAYNAMGRGEESALVEYTTVYFKRVLGTFSGNDNGISNGTIFALIVALPMALILLIIVAYNVRKRMTEEPDYPESYIEEDVDYNSGNDGLYSMVGKKKSNSYENKPTSGDPFVIHQGKTRRL